MQRRSLFIWVPVFLTIPMMIAIVSLRIWYLGPFGIHPGDLRVRAQMAQPSGERFFVVARRTERLVDAYEVFLCKVETNGEMFKYQLASDDSFWWRCSLRPTAQKNEVEIHLNSQLIGKYSYSQDAVVKARGKIPIYATKTSSAALEKALSPGRPPLAESRGTLP